MKAMDYMKLLHYDKQYFLIFQLSMFEYLICVNNIRKIINENNKQSISDN